MGVDGGQTKKARRHSLECIIRQPAAWAPPEEVDLRGSGSRKLGLFNKSLVMFDQHMSARGSWVLRRGRSRMDSYRRSPSNRPAAIKDLTNPADPTEFLGVLEGGSPSRPSSALLRGGRRYVTVIPPLRARE